MANPDSKSCHPGAPAKYQLTNFCCQLVSKFSNENSIGGLLAVHALRSDKYTLIEKTTAQSNFSSIIEAVALLVSQTKPYNCLCLGDWVGARGPNKQTT